jgi:hypothetical protein
MKKKSKKKISFAQMLKAALAKSNAPPSDIVGPEQMAAELDTTVGQLAKDRCTRTWGLSFIRLHGKILYSRAAVLNHLAKFAVNPTEPKPRRRNRKGGAA